MSFNKETGMYEGYIYKIINDVNDRIYIGQTLQTIKRRYYGHIYDATKNNNRDNNLIHNAMIKYGVEHFHVEIIKSYSNKDRKSLKNQLNSEEIKYINLYNSVRPNGYNISPGGGSFPKDKYVQVDIYDLECNFITSCNNVYEAEKITGISEAAIRKCYCGNNMRAGNYIFTKKGEVPVQPTSVPRRIVQLSLYSNEIINIYDNAKIASEVTGACHENIINCCNGKKYASTGGYRWIFEGDSINNDIPLQIVKVDMYSKKLEFLQTFDSIKDAVLKTGISQSSISSVITNKLKTAGGYIWRYHGEDISTYPFGEQPEKRNKPIDVYDIYLNFIGTYDSLGVLSKELNIPKGSISKFLKGNLLYNNQYYFQYHEQN